MLFCSSEFLYFFTVVFFVYWAMPWPRARVWLLLGASFYFYARWNQWLALLIGLSTVFDYWLARAMDAWTGPRWRRALLMLSLTGNLGLLVYFKYANFFLRSLEEGLSAAGQSASLPVLQVILPVGISFYTFEAINYMVDVYRRKIPAERNLTHFMLFITFFPHLVAGPIVRARDFLPQIRRAKRWDWARLQLGAGFFLVGLFKKLVVADRMAQLVDPVFQTPEAYGTQTMWLAALCYAIQIFCDFSGYTDMAIGCAHMFGYKLAQNFNLPYLARNISEFWRRWHISLSSWLRDYLFIPLGGSKGSEWQNARNLMIVMTLAGLWHGANWNFVVFGVLHGLMLVIHRWFRAGARRLAPLERALASPVGHVGCVAITFVAVCICFVAFRAATLSQAGLIWQRMFTAVPGMKTPVSETGLAVILAIVAVAHWLGQWNWLKIPAFRVSWQATAAAYCALLTMALLFAPKSGQAFIYFQF